MGIIQSLDVKKFSNFGDLAIFYLKHLTMLFEINSPRKLINSAYFYCSTRICFPVWDAAAFIYMIDPVPTSCM
jgi:hypothetical protein